MEAPETTVRKRRRRKTVLSEDEKKRRRAALVKRISKSRICIGIEIERWRTLQSKMGLKNDTSTAKFLLDWVATSDHLPEGSESFVAHTGTVVKPEMESSEEEETADPVSRRQSPTPDRRAEPLLMDCETVTEDNSSDSNNKGSAKKGQKVVEPVKVNFSSIHGLPVNMPFVLSYTSATISKTIESNIYMIVEQKNVKNDFLKQLYPVRINVNSDIQEILLGDKAGSNKTCVKKEENLKRIVLVNDRSLLNKTASSASNNHDSNKVSSSTQMGKHVDNNKVSSSAPVGTTDHRVRSSALLGKITSANTSTMSTNSASSGNRIRNDSSDKSVPVNKTVLKKKAQLYSMNPGNEDSNSTSLGHSTTDTANDSDGSGGEGHLDIVIKQEVTHDDGLYGYMEPASNENCDTVSDILDCLIDTVVETSKTSSTKRRNSSESKKPHKFFKFDGESSASNLPRSSRIRSQGYRVNYAQLNELETNSSDSIDDLLESDDCTEENPVPTSLKGKRGIPTADPDFELEDSFEDDSKLVAEGVSEHDETSETNEDMNETDEIEESHRDKMKLQKLKEQSKRIKVKLSEHTDKYFEEQQISIERKDRKKADSEKAVLILVCSLCNRYRTGNDSQMELHLEKHVNGDFNCKKCDYQGFSINDLQKHRAKHVTRKKITCFMCDERMMNSEAYRNHLESLHELLPWICFHCSTKEVPTMFKDRNTLRDHRLEMHKDKMYECKDCHQFYSSTNAIRTHSCKERSSGFTACEICGKTMSVMALVKHKQNVHYNVRQYPCQHCSYAAKQPKELKSHIQAKHEGTHSHKCELCDFTCVRAFQLTSHMRTHTGQKPYKCDQCPYAAAWNVQLKEHKRIHGGPFAKECEKCGVFVKKGAAYTKHIKKEHGDDT